MLIQDESRLFSFVRRFIVSRRRLPLATMDFMFGFARDDT